MTPHTRLIGKTLTAVAITGLISTGLSIPAQAAPTAPAAHVAHAEDDRATASQDPTAEELAWADQMMPHVSAEQVDSWYNSTIKSTGPDASGFYSAPSTLPDENGALIKSEAMNISLDPHHVIGVPAKATRIMYRTTDYRGNPVAVTGSVLESTKSWSGKGPRPLVSFAPGTQGLGDPCAPSTQLMHGREYEAISASALLNAGYNVVMTDYIGSGTSGTHSYLNRVDQAHAVLDAARAAGNFRSEIHGQGTPIGIWGYSQGGGASAAAGELAPEYAPELSLKGLYAGAVPADLQATLENIDSAAANAFLLMGLGGLGDSYGIDLSKYLNQKGLDTVEKVRNSCLSDARKEFASLDSSTLTLSGQKISAIMAQDPQFQQIIADNNLGQEGRHPSIPTLISSSWGDDVIPYQTNRKLAQRYCEAGTRVSFWTSSTPTHAAASLTLIPRGLIFLDRQFKDLPNIDDCWQVRNG